VGFHKPVALEAWHRAESFHSGVLSLDEWLHRHALQSHRSGGSRVFVTSNASPEVAEAADF
jgi:hypothetical protein